MQNFMPKSFGKKKQTKSLKKIKYRSSPDPENSRCGDQQPFYFFSVLAV